MSFDVYLGVLHVIWVSEENKCELEHWNGRERALEGLVISHSHPKPHRSRRPARLSTFTSQPTSQPGFYYHVSLFAHQSQVLVRKL